jgi:hypothetical protein
MTPTQYAKREMSEGRFPSMPITDAAGVLYLCDGDWNILEGKAYATKDAAETARSKILDRACCQIASPSPTTA